MVVLRLITEILYINLYHRFVIVLTWIKAYMFSKDNDMRESVSLLMQGGEMVLPIWLSDCSRNTQARVRCKQGRSAGDRKRADTSRGEKLCDIPIASGALKAHWVCIWFTRLWILLCISVRYLRATEGVGCGKKSQYEVTA